MKLKSLINMLESLDSETDPDVEFIVKFSELSEEVSVPLKCLEYRIREMDDNEFQTVVSIKL